MTNDEGMTKGITKREVFVSDTLLCDECGAAAVNAKETRPLVEMWGANGHRYCKNRCGRCGKLRDCTYYPDLLTSKPRPTVQGSAQSAKTLGEL